MIVPNRLICICINNLHICIKKFSLNTENTTLAVFLWRALSLHDGNCGTVAICPKMKVSKYNERAYQFFNMFTLFQVEYCALF